MPSRSMCMADVLCVICVSHGNMYMGVEGGVSEVQEGTRASMFPSCLCGHLLVIVLGSDPFIGKL